MSNQEQKESNQEQKYNDDDMTALISAVITFSGLISALFFSIGLLLLTFLQAVGLGGIGLVIGYFIGAALGSHAVSNNKKTRETQRANVNTETQS